MNFFRLRGRDSREELREGTDKWLEGPFLLLECPSSWGAGAGLSPSVRGEGVRPKMVVCPIQGGRCGEKVRLGSNCFFLGRKA